MIHETGLITIDNEKHRIAIRDFEECDIEHIITYWFKTDINFIRSMQVNPDKIRLLGEDELRKKMLTAPSDRTLSITVNENVMGSHGLTDLVVGESAIMHAHIFHLNFRRVGIGSFSYPRAARIFIERFNLKKIIFKTPIQNIGAQKVKENLGIKCIGEELINNPLLFEGTMGKIYNLTKNEALSIISSTAAYYK